MRPLSDKKRMCAVNFGNAFAKQIIRDYIKNPEWFPKGLSPTMMDGLCKASLCTSVMWDVTSQEEELAAKTCAETIELFLKFKESP